MQFMLGNTEEAARSFTEATALAQRRAESDPVNVETQRDLAVSLYKFMLVCQALPDLERWRTAARSAAEHFSRVDESSARDSRSKADLIRTLVAACGGARDLSDLSPADYQTALAWSRQLVELSENSDPEHLEMRATFQALNQDVAGALASLEQAIRLVPDGEEGAEMRERLAGQLEDLKRKMAAPSEQTEGTEVPHSDRPESG